MKIHAIFLVLFFLANQSIAQIDEEVNRKIDSIQKVISSTSNDTIKVNSLLNWSFLIYQTDPQADFHVNKKVEKVCRQNLKTKLSKELHHFYSLALLESLNNLGGNLMELGDYKSAIISHKEALELSIKIKNKIKEASSYTGLGNVYGEMGEHDKAVEYYRKSLSLHLINKSIESTSAVYNNLGLEANLRNYPDSALFYYRKSLVYTNFKEFPYDYITTINNIASVYSELKMDDSAKLSYEFCIRKSDSLGYKDLKSLACNNYANILMDLGEYDKAEKLYLEGEELAIKSSSILNSLDANDGLYSLYSKLGKNDLAIKHLQRMMLLKDSIYNEETKNMAIHEAFQLDYDRLRIQDSIDASRQKQIADLEIKTKNEELKNEKNKQIFFFSGIAIVFLFAGFMYNRFRITRKQKGIIEEQKLIVEEKQKEIVDSINYAKRIQKAILPSEKSLNSILPKHFVLYRPKDIVAGDFYWMETNENLIFLAVCDCTGHGVPGAMVSVVCHNALNRSVREFKLIDPGEILDKTRELVMQEFIKSDEDVKDGMDISLMVLDKSSLFEQKKTIKWAGANNPLWILKMDQLIEIKADKQPIGKYIDNKPFTTNVLEVNEGDFIYLFTDGYADQFGGDKGKKFKYSSLQKYLKEISKEGLNDQFNLLQQNFEKWKGNIEQVDDVCIIGVKL